MQKKLQRSKPSFLVTDFRTCIVNLRPTGILEAPGELIKSYKKSLTFCAGVTKWLIYKGVME